MKKSEIREDILKKFIKNCKKDGWSEENLAGSCKDLGINKTQQLDLFPSGLEDLTTNIVDKCNKITFERVKKIDFVNLRISEKIEEITYQKIFTYHEFFEDLEVLKKFTAYGIELNHISNSALNIWSFSSDAWEFIGDSSTDFSYYTKRFSLSGVYLKTFVYSLSDKSEHLENTRKFLKRTIDGLMKFHKLKSKIWSYIPKNNFIAKKRV